MLTSKNVKLYSEVKGGKNLSYAEIFSILAESVAYKSRFQGCEPTHKFISKFVFVYKTYYRIQTYCYFKKAYKHRDIWSCGVILIITLLMRDAHVKRLYVCSHQAQQLSS